MTYFTFSYTKYQFAIGIFRETTVLVGDPGRHTFRKTVTALSEHRTHLLCLAQYHLPAHTVIENRGFSSAYVWQLFNKNPNIPP